MARQKFADESHGKPGGPKPGAPGPKAGESAPNGADIHDAVAQHGPAQKVEMHHDHEAKSSRVTSHHQEHKNEASFHGESHVKDATDHAAAASGATETQADPGLSADSAPAQNDVASMLA